MEHLNGFIVDSSVLNEYRSGAGFAKKIFLGALEKIGTPEAKQVLKESLAKKQ